MRMSQEERRRAIIEAAMPLFARQGFAGTTTKLIAREAGVSEALLFQHFPTKVELYRAIVAEGCRGEPELQELLALPPSTATLVRMVRAMVEHFVLQAADMPREGDVRCRLMTNSFLADGEYARLVSGWIAAEILPQFTACLAAAGRAGDLQALPPRPVNVFWFGHHVAAMIALTRLPDPGAIAYDGAIEAVIADAVRFILRGLGLSEAAIRRHEPAEPTARSSGPLSAA
jgi:AcrR family transcriptional regulator